MDGMFCNCPALEALDASTLDTESARSMVNMFSGCSNMKSLELWTTGTWDVGNMNSMFANCSALETLDASGLNTWAVQDMASMFEGCSSLAELYLWTTPTRNAKYMNGMFKGCSSLESLDTSALDTSCAERLGGMFQGCAALAELDVSGFNTSQVESMSSMFEGCSSLTTLDVSNFDVTNVTQTLGFFQDCTSLASITLWKPIDGESQNIYMASMFEGCSSLTTINNLDSLDTSAAQSLSYMFKDCSSLTSLDLTPLDTKNAEYMTSLFEGCSSLETIKVGDSWSTRLVYKSGSANMFLDCAKLVGDEGTAYDPEHLNAEYAHIDGEDGPGYLSGTKTSLKNAVVSVAPAQFTYDKSAKEPQDITVTLNGTELSKNRDYSVSWVDNTEVGTAYVEVTGLNDYRGTARGAFTINPVPVTVSAAGATKVYGAADPKLSAGVSGLLPGDSADLISFTVLREQGDDVGTYAITPTGDAVQGYYAVSFEPASLAITPAANPMTVKAKSVKTTYNAKSACELARPLTVTGAVGTVTYAKSSGDSRLKVDKATGKVTVAAGTPAGTYSLGITAKAAGNANYKTGSKTVTATIEVTQATSSIALAAQSKTYTGKALSYTGKVTKSGSTGKVTYKYYSDSACTKEVKAANVKAAGTYYVKATLAADKNYKKATSKAVKLTIAKAAASVKQTVKTKTYKASNLKSKALSFNAFTVTTDGKVTYTVTKNTNKKYISFKAGKVTVAKGTPKKTYTLTVKISAGAGKNYKALAAKAYTVKVTVS